MNVPNKLEEIKDYTPGPWFAEYIVAQGWVVRWDNPESQICSLRWIGGPHPPEVDARVKADAQLIAAAPRLIAKVKELEGQLEYCEKNCRYRCLDGKDYKKA